MPDSDIDPEVYKQACEDARYYGDMRFKQLTLWSVGMGFFLKLSYEQGALAVHQKGILCLAAFFWTTVIWVMEVRSSVHGARRFGIALSRLEGLGDTDLSNKWTLFSATNAVALLYAVSCTVATVQLARAWGSGNCYFWFIVLVLVLLVAFTVREYWPMLKHAVIKWRF